MAAVIKKVWGQVIHDSRGDDTVQATVQDEMGGTASAAVPGSGGSKGSFEAATVEAPLAVENITQHIEPVLLGKDPANQSELDRVMIELDGTASKAKLGSNAILAVSMALSRLAANNAKLPLYRYIGALDGREGFTVPIPMMNLINGGKHAHNNLDIQEFMVVPDALRGYHNQLSAGKLIFSTLGTILREENHTITTGDEGGYAPNLDTNEIAFDYLVRAIKQSGYKTWEEVSLAVDVAASSLPPTFEVTPTRYMGLLHDFPILSLEDPFGEDDWPQWIAFLQEMEQSNPTTKKLMLVGDDLFVTNPERLKRGIEQRAANSILLKLNQIGTVSETIAVAQVAHQAGFITIMSHRSGETLDDFIADFAVGIGCQFIKTGAPNDAHPERMTKYRRLLSIEQELTANDARQPA